ncbi:uracil-DNA glycosylase [Prosthecomicrobium hirschii]|uniref:uracil-DNA glycosylase n=1 Tax=Prosthecodimorpha hirschii TaxID=665126 RepID=UPI002220A157|nr:uracil-DNA glycosylase [Prosthecomicrobium hirschii]MCW1838754.1 uracil-DNA glycosylase [Prosthecomicrobium hirschii]
MNPATFVQELASYRFENAFNPYADACPDFDAEDAPAVRKQNLEAVLNAAIERGVHSFWIARDLGYRGGRRTGLALTDEAHLDCHSQLLGTKPLRRATRGPLVAERTATVVWQMLRSIDHPIFLWNVFPFHPHGPGEPMTNRCHTRKERIACKPLLRILIEALNPKHLVAIGRDAQAALTDLGLEATAVRHPSYGGQSEFVSELEQLYSVRMKPVRETQIHLL